MTGLIHSNLRDVLHKVTNELKMLPCLSKRQYVILPKGRLDGVNDRHLRLNAFVAVQVME